MKFIKNKKYTLLNLGAKVMLSFVLVFAVAMPLYITHAAGGSPTGGGGSPAGQGGSPTGGGGATNTDESLQLNVKINNPLSSGINDIPSFIEALLNIVLTIGVPIVALEIIYSGFLFVKAQGNEEQLKSAKKALQYTLIGATLLLGSWIIANAIKGTVDEIKRTS